MELTTEIYPIYKALSKATIKAFKNHLNDHDHMKEMIKAYVTVRYGTGKIMTYTSAYNDMMSSKPIRFAVESLQYYLELVRDGVIKRDNFHTMCDQLGRADSMYINDWTKETRTIIEDEYTM